MRRTTLFLACLMTACGGGPASGDPAKGHRFVPRPSLTNGDAVATKHAPLQVAGCGAAAAILCDALDAWSDSGHRATRLSTHGETAGLTAVATGKADLAVTCRPALPEDKRRGLRFVPLGWSPLTVAVHPDNPLQNLSRTDLCAILTGGVKRWTELGIESRGPWVERLGLLRSDDGQARTVRQLLDLPLDGHFPVARRFACPTALVTALAETPGGIAMCDATLARRAGLRLVSLDGVPASRKAVQADRYPLRQQVYVALPRHPLPAAQELVAFLRGDGQELLTLLCDTELTRPAAPPSSHR